jgi:hypothetical protein
MSLEPARSPSLGAFNERGDQRGDCPTATVEEASRDCVTLATSPSNSFETGAL